MLTKIKKVMAPPVFEDENTTRVASLLNAILFATFVIITFFTLIMYPVETTTVISVTVGLTIGILSLVGWLVMRRGYIRLISMVFSFVLFVGITGVVCSSGTIRSPIVGAFVVNIIIAGVLVGNRAAVTLYLLCLLTLFGVFQAETAGLLPTPSAVTEINQWMIHSMNFSVVVVLLILTTNSIAKALDRVRHNERALAESNRDLQDIRASLEQRNERLQETVRRYGDYVTEIGQGNLSVWLSLDEYEQKDDDPLAVMGRKLNEMATGLRTTIAMTRNASISLNFAAAGMLVAATEQSSGASNQSAAILQTSTTVDELETISEQATARAQEVVGASQRTVEVSRSGQHVVQETIEGMHEIKQLVEGIAENILALSEQTQQVGEIIATVNNIAAQSNILALNASVEAARAGEYGKGFAVVAVEVRNLAEQSRQATAQVKSILSEIQKATNATVMATEEGTKGVDKGVQLVTQAQQAIEQLSRVIDESAHAATQVVAGGRQQQAGIRQIAQAMQSLNQTTIQNLAGAHEAEQAAQDLSDLASGLDDIVVQYQL